jgi:hypothetical protein
LEIISYDFWRLSPTLLEIGPWDENFQIRINQLFNIGLIENYQNKKTESTSQENIEKIQQFEPWKAVQAT